MNLIYTCAPNKQTHDCRNTNLRYTNYYKMHEQKLAKNLITDAHVLKITDTKIKLHSLTQKICIHIEIANEK